MFINHWVFLLWDIVRVFDLQGPELRERLSWQPERQEGDVLGVRVPWSCSGFAAARAVGREDHKSGGVRRFLWHCPFILLPRGDSLTPFFFKKIIFIYLSVLGLSCGIWDLVSRPGIEPRPPALGTWSLSHWATREVPLRSFFMEWAKAFVFLTSSQGSSVGPCC